MKRTKLPSRKRRALRRVLFALVLLFLVNHILLIGLLFPIQAIRQNEERAGTGRTAVVFRDWAPEIHWGQLMYLTENENVTMLSGTCLTPFGWTGSSGVQLDCTEPAPVHGRCWSIGQDEDRFLLYVFGRIDDPDIDFLEVFLLHRDDPLEEEKIGRLSGSRGIGRDSDSWKEKDGRSYFLLETYPVEWSSYPDGFRVIAVGYDTEGKEIVRQELD